MGAGQGESVPFKAARDSRKTVPTLTGNDRLTTPIASLISRNVPSVCVMREPPVKKVLYWCEECNVPLLAKSCACGREGKRIELLQPYDLRPALSADHELISRLMRERYGDIPLAQILLLNKTGGVDRADLVIMHGERLGWLTFDPVSRAFALDLTPEALPFLVSRATKGIVDLDTHTNAREEQGRIGGKRIPLTVPSRTGP